MLEIKLIFAIKIFETIRLKANIQRIEL